MRLGEEISDEFTKKPQQLVKPKHAKNQYISKHMLINRKRTTLIFKYDQQLNIIYTAARILNTKSLPSFRNLLILPSRLKQKRSDLLSAMARGSTRW